ncbi:MAG: hypothetical protein ABIJ16_09575 [Bacteroidota bacterium]
MKRIVIILGICIVFFASCEDDGSTRDNSNTLGSENINNELPEILAGRPVRLEVVNEPDVIFPVRDDKDSTMFIWKLKTFVKSTNGDIRITEFGDFVRLDNGEWKLHNYTGKMFTAKQFEEWYFVNNEGEFTWQNAEKGIIKKGIQYVDMSNWTEKSDSIDAHTGIWFFIGIDENGNKVMGYDHYENRAELQEGS